MLDRLVSDIGELRDFLTGLSHTEAIVLEIPGLMAGDCAMEKTYKAKAAETGGPTVLGANYPGGVVHRACR